MALIFVLVLTSRQQVSCIWARCIAGSHRWSHSRNWCVWFAEQRIGHGPGSGFDNPGNG